MPQKPNAEEIREMLATRRWCYYVMSHDFIEGRGYRIAVVIENLSGYLPTGGLDKAEWRWGPTLADAEHICYEKNLSVGRDEKQVAEIVSSSMQAQFKEEKHGTERGE